MDLKLNDDQNMLKKVAADFLKAEAPSYVITEWFQKKVAFIRELHKKTAQVGWSGMLVPDEFGGGGATCTDCAVVANPRRSAHRGRRARARRRRR